MCNLSFTHADYGNSCISLVIDGFAAYLLSTQQASDVDAVKSVTVVAPSAPGLYLMHVITNITTHQSTAPLIKSYDNWARGGQLGWLRA